MGIPAATFIFFRMLRLTGYGCTAKLNTKGPKCALLLRFVLDDQGAGKLVLSRATALYSIQL